MPTEKTKTDEINRFTCPNCGTQMKIVQVITCLSTDYFWDCPCMIKAWNKEIYDTTEHF